MLRNCLAIVMVNICTARLQKPSFTGSTDGLFNLTSW